MKYFLLCMVLFDVLWIALLVPMLPQLQAYFGVGPLAIALGLSLYELFALFMAPIFWQVSDKIGRKVPLFLSVFGSAVAWLVLWLTHSLVWYLLARVVSGVFGGNISVLQACLSDVCRTPHERKAAFGLFGAMFGLAFLVGPLIVQFLLPFGMMAPFYFSAGVCFFNSLLVLLILPETHQTTRPIQWGTVFTGLRLQPFSGLAGFATDKRVSFYFFSFVLLSLGMATYNSSFTLYVSQAFTVSLEKITFFLSLVGMMWLVSQGVLLRVFWLKMSHLWQEVCLHVFTLSCAASLLIGGVFLDWEHWKFLALFVPVINVYNSVYVGEIAQHSDPAKRGEVLGLLGSVMNASFLLGPLVWSLLLELDLSPVWVLFVCSCMSAVLVCLAKWEEYLHPVALGVKKRFRK